MKLSHCVILTSTRLHAAPGDEHPPITQSAVRAGGGGAGLVAPSSPAAPETHWQSDGVRQLSVRTERVRAQARAIKEHKRASLLPGQ